MYGVQVTTTVWSLILIDLFISLLGFLLILLLCTEEFQGGLRKLWQGQTSQPGGKYLDYPLALVLGVAAAGLIVFSLWSFMSTTFSYD